jgi:hypothetical protein
MFNTSHFNTTLSTLYFYTFSVADIPIYPTLVNVNINSGANINFRHFSNPQFIYLDNSYLYNQHNNNLNLNSYSLINIPIYPTLGNLNINANSELYITRFFNPQLIHLNNSDIFNSGNFNYGGGLYLNSNSIINVPIYPTLVGVNLEAVSEIYVTRFFNPRLLFIDCRGRYNLTQSLTIDTNSIFNCPNFYSGVVTSPNSGIPYLNVLFGACLTDGAYPKLWQLAEVGGDTNWVTISRERSFDWLFKYSEEFYYRVIDSMGRIWVGENTILIHELTADFSADDTCNIYPLTVQFTAITNGRNYEGTQYLWEWAHEDDSGNWVEFSREIDPEYTFEVSGKYSVRFTVVSPGGENRVQIIKENYIEAQFSHTININYTEWLS